MKSVVYVCLTVHNRSEYTNSCIQSILKQSYKKLQIIVCDDGSTDNTAEILQQFNNKVKVLKGDGTLWWAGGMNQCIKYVLDQHSVDDVYIFTLNNDTELEPNTIETVVSTHRATSNEKTIIGAVNVFYSNSNKIEPSAFIYRTEKWRILKKVYSRVNKWGEEKQYYHGTVDVDALTGKGVLLPIKVYQEIGLYNSRALPHYHADTEFIFRARKSGWRVLLTYDTKILSHQEQSGIGTITSSPKVFDLFRSFFNIKSPHYLSALYNRSKLLYGKMFLPYFLRSIFTIIIGFLKRYFSDKFHIF